MRDRIVSFYTVIASYRVGLLSDRIELDWCRIVSSWTGVGTYRVEHNLACIESECDRIELV